MNDPGLRHDVWLVEDSALEGAQARRALEPTCEVSLFPDGPSMLERIASSGRPSLLILDVALPGMSGIEVCRFVRESQSATELPILMLTVVGQKSDVVAGLKAGANDYVTKPYDASELGARVEGLLRMKAMFDRAQAAERAREVALADARSQRERLNTFFMDAPAAVCLLRGADHLCEFANAKYLALFGGPGLLWTSFREKQPAHHEGRLLRILDAVYATGEPYTAQVMSIPLPGPKGASREGYFKVTYQPSRDGNGKIGGVDVFLFDISDQVLAQQKLEQFLSQASHELKTPITSVLLHVQLMLQGLSKETAQLEPGKLVHRLDAIDRQVRRQMSLIENLLDVSRISNGKLPVEPEEVDVPALAREVAERFEEEQRHSGSILNLHTEPQLVAVVDRLRLDQAITNLVSNALKYGRGKPIDLSIEAIGTRRIRISVQDQGIGIQPESLPFIFDQFERGVSDRHYPGFGLGLWITQQVVAAMNGTVSVESTPDQGSTFTLEVPRSALAPPAAAE